MSIEFPNVITSGTDASAIKQQFSFLTCWLRNLSSYISYHVIALLERNFHSTVAITSLLLPIHNKRNWGKHSIIPIL